MLRRRLDTATRAVVIVIVLGVLFIVGWLWRWLSAVWNVGPAGVTWQGQIDAVFSIYNVLFTVAGLSLALLGLWFAYRELKHIREDRDAEITLEMFRRYLEDPDLFCIRGLVHDYRTQIHDALVELNPTDHNRKKLDQRLMSVSAGKLGLNGLVRLVMAMEHASVVMRQGFLSPEASRIFDVMISGWWEILHEFVRWERVAREPSRENYAQAFEGLAMELRSRNLNITQPVEENGADPRWSRPILLTTAFLLVLCLGVAFVLDQLAWRALGRPNGYSIALSAIGSGATAIFTLFAGIVAAVYVFLTYGLWREAQRQANASREQLRILRQQSIHESQKDAKQQIKELRDAKPIVFTERNDDDRHIIVNVGNAPAMNVWYVAQEGQEPVPLGSVPKGGFRTMPQDVDVADRHLLVAEARPAARRKWTPTINVRIGHVFCHGFIELGESLNYQGSLKGFLGTKTPDLFVKLREWDPRPPK